MQKKNYWENPPNLLANSIHFSISFETDFRVKYNDYISSLVCHLLLKSTSLFYFFKAVTPTANSSL